MNHQLWEAAGLAMRLATGASLLPHESAKGHNAKIISGAHPFIALILFLMARNLPDLAPWGSGVDETFDGPAFIPTQTAIPF